MIPPSNCQLRSPLVEPFTLCFVLRGRLIVARSIRRVSRGSVFGDFAAAHEAPPWHGSRCSAYQEPEFAQMAAPGRRDHFAGMSHASVANSSRLLNLLSHGTARRRGKQRLESPGTDPV